MTIVIGRQFGNRIIMLSDTMITDLHGVKHHKLPGRLKAVVLGTNISVAFAGDADAGLAAIREAKRALDAGEAIEATVQNLAHRACRLGGLCEFLVATHDPQPALRKITAAGLSQPTEGAVIGDLRFLDLLPGYAAPLSPDDKLGRAMEQRLSHEFSRLFLDRVGELPMGIGGVPINLLASPFGHTYQGQAAAFSWDSIDLTTGATEEQFYDQKTGKTDWRYSVQCPDARGLGIVSLYLPQPGIGYVFDPISFDEPVACHGLSQEEFEQAVMARTS